jgi:osmotically-inducible protein OsmY
VTSFRIALPLCVGLTAAILGCAKAASQDNGMESLRDTTRVSADKIKSGAIEYVDDPTIKARVIEKLVAESATIAYQVTVTTVKGSVNLSGTVSTADDRNKVVAIARAVPGVRSIENDLILKSETGSAGDGRKIGTI